MPPIVGRKRRRRCVNSVETASDFSGHMFLFNVNTRSSQRDGERERGEKETEIFTAFVAMASLDRRFSRLDSEGQQWKASFSFTVYAELRLFRLKLGSIGSLPCRNSNSQCSRAAGDLRSIKNRSTELGKTSNASKDAASWETLENSAGLANPKKKKKKKKEGREDHVVPAICERKGACLEGNLKGLKPVAEHSRRRRVGGDRSAPCEHGNVENSRSPAPGFAAVRISQWRTKRGVERAEGSVL
jgi:hypothetical protein